VNQIWKVVVSILVVGVFFMAVANAQVTSGGPGGGSSGGPSQAYGAIPHTVSFSGGIVKIKGLEKPEWPQSYHSGGSGVWAGGATSSDPPGTFAEPGYVKCSDDLKATITINLSANKLPPAVVIEETVTTDWSGVSGDCDPALVGSGETSGPFDRNESHTRRTGYKSVKCLTIGADLR
jgi:hypothetical protein